MIKNKAYKFRLLPNEQQKELITKTFGCVRFIYNKMLEDKINAYKQDGINLKVAPAQYKDEFEFLREVDSHALGFAWVQLNSAYNNFFRGLKRGLKVGFPKFKSKKYSKNSYTTCIANKDSTSIRVEDNNYIVLPKLGRVKFKKSREVEGKIKQATISLTATGHYNISILVEYEWEKPDYTIDKDNSIGLDYSSPDFYVDNFGNSPNKIKFFRYYEDKLAKELKKLSHMKYGSNNYLRLKVKVAKVYEKIANSRLDFCHKLSKLLAETYDIVCVEDINLRAMALSLRLGKATNDNGFGMFRTFLLYKLEDRGKLFVKIERWEPTSTVCSCCGCYHKDIVSNLSVRLWVCPDCGTEHNRDQNAALNIRNLGLRAISL